MVAKIKQEVLVDGVKYILEGDVDFSNMTIKKLDDGGNVDPEVPPVDPTNPNVPTEGTIKPGGWGADTSNKDAWKVVNMKNPADQFKIVDGAGKNVATNFTTKEVATNFIAYFKVNEFPPKDTTTPDPEAPPVDPKPQPPVVDDGTENKNSKGVIIKAKIKQGGQTVVSQEKAERSVHNQSNEKNIQRDSIYGNPKSDKKNDTVNFATTAYINTELSKDDQVDFKRCGGGHGDSNPKEGRCYPVGVMINKGKPSGPYIAKEYPQHSTTPKFSNKTKVVKPEPLPDLNGKSFGIQTIGYSTGATYKFECWLDLSVLDKSIEEIKKGPVPNKWELYFTAEDKGDWVGEPYTTHQGLGNGGTSLMLYGRIDHVTKPTEFTFCEATEIEPNLQ